VLAGVGVVAGSFALASPAGALTTPGAPTGLSGTAGRAIAQVSLSWLAPADTGGGIGTYLYDVATDYDSGSGTGTWSALVDLRRTTTTATAPCAAVYPAVCTYRLYARNAAGTSTPSTPFTVPWSVPSYAARLRATSTNFTDVDLTWRTPSNTGGLPVRYDVEVSNDLRVTWTALAVDLTGTAYSAPGSCTNGRFCYYRVWAKNDVGTAVRSSNKARVRVSPGYVQDVALSKTADDVTTGNATSGEATMLLTWNPAVVGLADGPFELQQCSGVCVNGGFLWSASIVIPNATLTATRTCPAGVITCSFRIRATNTRGGVGLWTYRVYRPTAPFGVSAVTGATTGTVSVTYSGPGDPGVAVLTGTYEFLVCETGCDSSANWSVSSTTAAYPPASQPATTEVNCPTSGASCSVRLRFENDVPRTSMVSPAVTATAAP
jgi:hypothetical protein